MGGGEGEEEKVHMGWGKGGEGQRGWCTSGKERGVHGKVRGRGRGKRGEDVHGKGAKEGEIYK